MSQQEFPTAAAGRPQPDPEDAGNAPPPLKSRIIRGSAWSVVSLGLGHTLALARSVILARLLFPEAFGLMALVGVFMQGLQLFSDIGIGPSIIQNERGDEPAFLNTAWTIQAIRGCGLWVCSCIIAWPVSVLYDEPMLVQLIPVAGLNALIGGFNSTSLLTLRRHLVFGRPIILSLVTAFFGAGVTIGAALMLRSVWALVFGMLLSSLLMMVFSHIVLPGIRNRFQWNRQAAGALFHFGKWIFLSTALVFFAQQMDRLLLGKLVPMDMLGVYYIALRVAFMPLTIAISSTRGALYPSFAQIARTDRDSLPWKLRKARRVVLAIGILATLGMAFCSPVFFRYLYDQRYHDAGWIAQLLALVIWFSILQQSADRALLSLGNSRALALSNLCKLIVTGAGCMAGYAAAGLPGFILGAAGGALAGHAVIVLALQRHGISIFRQDAAHTAWFLGLGCIGALGPRLLTWCARTDLSMGGIQSVGIAGVILIAVGVWAVRRCFAELR